MLSFDRARFDREEMVFGEFNGGGGLDNGGKVPEDEALSGCQAVSCGFTATFSLSTLSICSRIQSPTNRF